MATRLNTEIRSQILRNAIDAQFGPKLKAQRAAEIAMCRTVFEATTTKAEREHIAALPKHWFGYPPSVWVVTAQGHTLMLESDKTVPVPSGRSINSMGSDSFKLHGDKLRPLSDQVQKLVEAREDLKQARTKAYNALTLALRKVQTFERLIEQWPEGKDFYQSPPLAKPLSLPAVRFSEVNAMLGIGG